MRWLPFVLAVAVCACDPPRTGPGTGGTADGWWVADSYLSDGRIQQTTSPIDWLTISGGAFQISCASGTVMVSGVRIRFTLGPICYAGIPGPLEGNLLAARTFTATEDTLQLFDSGNYEIAVFHASATDPRQP